MNGGYKISLRRLNNKVIKTIPFKKEKDDRPIKGVEVFPKIYANIALIAKKKSGKTTAIYNIITNCISKGTTVYAFVSTLYLDDGWKGIREYCEKKEIPFIGY